MDIQQQALIQICQDSLLAYSCFTNKNYSIQRHHRVIAEVLERVESGELRKVMIFMPPRFGKSEEASINFPSWFLGRNPEKSFMLGSYAAGLANSFSRKTRNLYDSDNHKYIFEGRLAKDSRAVNQWHTDHGGSMISAGIGGGVTGKGGDILMVDDIVKNQQDADSPLLREKAWDWYQTTFRTRKMDDQSAEIIMMTRWHEDDLAGRLLAAEDDWFTVTVPALKKNGESNWPEKFSTEYFRDLEKRIGPRAWASLYMQNPKPIGGGLFKREYFKYYTQAQLDTREIDITKMERITFLDPAISLKQSADYTSIVTIGVLDGDVYQLNVIRKRMEPDEIIDTLFEVVKAYNPHRVGVESIAYQKMLILEIRKQMNLRGVSFVMEEIKPMGEKAARIASILHSKYITGKIYHLKGDDNVPDLEDELLCFPLGTHDDTIDALSGAVKMIGESVAAVWKGNQGGDATGIVKMLPNIIRR